MPQAVLRILNAVVKASLRRAVGDPTLQAVADELAALGHADLARRLDELLGQPDRRQALTAALRQADACAQERLASTRLHGLARDLPLRDLPSLLGALEDLPADDLEETRLTAALEAVLQRDWRLPPEQARSVAGIYLTCLREALLKVETNALLTVGRAVLRTEQAVTRLAQALQTWEEKERRALYARLDALQQGIADLKQGQQKILERLDEIRRPPSRHSAVPFQAPPLPGHFVRRDEAAAPVRRDLLAEGSGAPGVLVVSAIHGLGSVGKSTLAAYLAHLDAVRQRFPDGVLWATLGQRPDLLRLLAGWIRALGEDYTPLSVEDASAYLRSVLRDRAVLLVVDDAWHGEHVRPFLVGGPRCRGLITTREADIARAVGARLHELDVLTPGQALELLEKRLQRPLTEEERTQSETLARTVGYLPLALELAAAQLQDGLSWEELLADLRTEIARLEALELPTAGEALSDAERKRLSLRASFNLSLRRLPRRHLEAFAWLGVLPEDVTITADLTTALWEVPRNEAQRRLRYFQAKALLMMGERRPGARTYRLHDLLHDMARRLLTASPEPQGPLDLPGLGLRWQAAHDRLLARYRARTQNGLWHTLPDDGYIHEHLTWHMEQAGREDALVALFREETEDGRHGWYTALDRLGRTDIFLQDLARLWALTDRWRDIGLQVRWALMEASLHSLAGNLPSKLPALLVENDLWTPPQALAHVRQMPDEGQKAEALKALAPVLARQDPARLEEALDAARSIRNEEYRAYALSTLAPHLPPALREQALAEALAAVRSIKDDKYRVHVLSSLAPHLLERKREEAMAEALMIAQNLPEKNARGPGSPRAEALASLAPHLPEGLLSQALDAAQGIRDEWPRTRVLAALAPHLPEELLPQALDAARSIRVEEYRAHVLSALGPRLPKALLAQALDAARSIEDKGYRAYALSALAPHLSERLLAQVLDAVQSIRDGQYRAEALAALSPHLPKRLLAQALEAARSLPERGALALGSPRGRALAALAPYLPPELLAEALDAVRSIEDEWRRAETLSALAPHLPPDLLAEALDMARSMGDEGYRARVLTALTPHLPERLLTEALDAVRNIEDEYWRSRALTDVTPHLSERLREDILTKTLKGVQSIRDKIWQTECLSVLASYLPTALGRTSEEMLAEALDAARSIEDEWARVEFLLTLAQYLPKELREEALIEALNAVRNIEWEDARADALVALIPHIPEALLTEALDAGQKVQSKWRRAEVLAALAPRLSKERRESLLLEALHTIQEFPEEGLYKGFRLRGLVALVPYLPGRLQSDILATALDTARHIESMGIRAYALASLVSNLPEGMQPDILLEALDAAKDAESDQLRAKALAALAPRLPEGLLSEALVAARNIRKVWYRARALSALAPRLAEIPAERLYPLWAETLPILARRTRRDLLADLRALAPVIHALGGQEAVAETFRAIQDVGRWWG